MSPPGLETGSEIPDCVLNVGDISLTTKLDRVQFITDNSTIMHFVLDSRLRNDGLLLADTSNYVITLANDSRFPWVIVIPKVPDITEIYQLDPLVQQRLARDSNLLGMELMQLFNGDSLNTGALGNVVSQLHLHHVVRFKTDAAWPGPVWGAGQAIPYTDKAASLMIANLQNTLTLTG